MNAKSQKGLSGISTLIIFIAIILVAAVAALVLLQTVGSLQSQALATGKQSKSQVSTRLQVESVIGYVPETNAIDYLRVTAKLAPGSGKVGLSDTTLSFNDGTAIETGISYSSGIANNTEEGLHGALSAAETNTTYDVLFLGEASGYSSDDISSGQMVEFWYDAPNIGNQVSFELGVHPDVGSIAEVFIKTPASYDDNFVALYP